MNPLVLSMNDVLRQWKEQYDIFTAIPHQFEISHGILNFAHLPVCKAEDDFEMTSANFDAESIRFFFPRNRSIVISVSWPEDKPPEVSSVAFIHFLKEGDYHEILE